VETEGPAQSTAIGSPAQRLLSPEGAPGPTSRLLAEALLHTDEELLAALRARLTELERRAGELEAQALDAQARLGALVKKTRARSEETEQALIAALLPWAQDEAVAIIRDARRRAAELDMGVDAPHGTAALDRLLVTHFELQERLVRLVAELTHEASDLGERL
jgi:hypothetical protein